VSPKRQASRVIPLVLLADLGFRCSKLSPSGDIVKAFLAMIRNCGKRAVRGMDRPKVSGGFWRELWSNHGPRIGANAYLIRLWEPPASRIFNQLRVNRVLSRRKRGFESLRGRQLIQLLPRNFVRIYLHCTGYRFSLLFPEIDSHSFPRLPSVTISARGFSNTFAV
jgi:hypothetical protein